MLEVASLIVVNLIIATVIGFIIGLIVGRASVWSFSSNPTPTISSQAQTGINPVFKKNSSVDNKPLVLSSPKAAGKDNLRKIKGIDYKVEEDLNNLGIYHFEQISKWSSKNCDWIDEFLLLPGQSKKFQWVEQAKILASGRDTVYSKRIEEESGIKVVEEKEEIN